MKLAIMQPYFLPYIGYFQLMDAVDTFVVYDNIEFTKKGWINRNRILVNGKDEYITLPLKKDSDYLHVCQRFLADSWESDKKKMINKLREAYRKAPRFDHIMPLMEACINYPGSNLFDLIYNSILLVRQALGIETNIIKSSELQIDHQLKSAAKVLAICKELNATEYINSIGGYDLYSGEIFESHHIRLQFLKTDPISYTQFSHPHVPYLSIADVLMFNDRQQVSELLSAYTLVSGNTAVQLEKNINTGR